MVEITGKEQGNNIEQVRSTIDSLMGALIEAQKHYPPEKRARGQEAVLSLMPQVKEIGYDQILSGIDKRLLEEVKMLQNRMSGAEAKMKKVLNGAPNPANTANDALNELASYKTKLPDYFCGPRGIFHLSEVKGLILAWQIEETKESQQIK